MISGVTKKVVITFLMLLTAYAKPVSASPKSAADCDPIHIEANRQIHMAWYHWDPYQSKSEAGKVEGLDVAMVKAIFNASGYHVSYNAEENSSWQDNQDSVICGLKYAVSGAFKTPDRENRYLISQPYRKEWNALYLHKDSIGQWRIHTVNQLMELLQSERLRLGVVEGYKYTEDRLNSYIANNKYDEKIIVTSKTEEESFNKLKNKDVDIIVSDRLTGARILWNEKLDPYIFEHSMPLGQRDIHLLIHKSTDPETNNAMQAILTAFNLGVTQLKHNGDLDKIQRHYLFPLLMKINVQRGWFYFIDLLGAVFFSIAGLLIARDNKYDFFGTLVMVSLLATGGGLVRDIIVGRTPVVISSPDYLYIVITVSIIGFLFFYFHGTALTRSQTYRLMVSVMQRTTIWPKLRYFIESLALAAYTIIGVGVAVDMKTDPLWLWGPMLGCLTSCGGGVLAAALRQDRTNMCFKGGLDPECSLIWGIIFSLFLMWQTNRINPHEVMLGVILTLSLCTLTLIWFAVHKWRSPRMLAALDKSEQCKN